MNKLENENIEIKLLIEAVLLKYGYDFRDYSKAHIKRRIKFLTGNLKAKNISELQHRLIYKKNNFYDFLNALSINTTEMFRDAPFYLEVRNMIIPLIMKNAFNRIWHAGCSTGEEVYSMSILLMENNLSNNTQVYATDFNSNIINKAREGIYPLALLKDYTRNYQKSGGINPFSDYYFADNESVIMKKKLKENILFSEHNLVTDGVFNEMEIILCRNVLIYFNKSLQNHVIKLFYDSLPIGGILCLGTKESLQFTEYNSCFKEISGRQRIYKKIK